jgi:hypothetical protein
LNAIFRAFKASPSRAIALAFFADLRTTNVLLSSHRLWSPLRTSKRKQACKSLKKPPRRRHKSFSYSGPQGLHLSGRTHLNKATVDLFSIDHRSTAVSDASTAPAQQTTSNAGSLAVSFASNTHQFITRPTMHTTGFSYIQLNQRTHLLSMGLFEPFPLTQLIMVPLPGFQTHYFHAVQQNAMLPYLGNSCKADFRQSMHFA